MDRAIRFSTLTVLALIASGNAWANIGIAGPLMHYGASLSTDPWQWIGVCMFMCVSVEAAVFAYSRQYKRPFLASFYANVISLLYGIPLGLLAIVDPTWFVLPTLASIIVEYWAIRTRRNWFEFKQNSITESPIIWGNFLSNLILVGLMAFVVKR